MCVFEVLQSVAACCSTSPAQLFPQRLRRTANIATPRSELWCSALQRVAARCSALQRVAARCSVLQRVAVHHLHDFLEQCVAVRCSVLQRVAVLQHAGALCNWWCRSSPARLSWATVPTNRKYCYSSLQTVYSRRFWFLVLHWKSLSCYGGDS